MGQSEDLQRCRSRGRRNATDMFTREVRRSRRTFPNKGCMLEHQILQFAKAILHDRCNTSYDFASLFRGKRSAANRWTENVADLQTCFVFNLAIDR